MMRQLRALGRHLVNPRSIELLGPAFLILPKTPHISGAQVIDKEENNVGPRDRLAGIGWAGPFRHFHAIGRAITIKCPVRC